MNKHSMSNLDSSPPKNNGGGFFPPEISQSSFTPPPHDQPPPPAPTSKKRSLPGNPDPDAEVIAMSPKSLMATNRFLCDICNKGFQRDQNLQLHRRGHNLPWKLKQKSSKEVVRKKVYVCPEPSCVHHRPSRALGDLTGIKKHFFRKHGEKNWKCDKCTKRYAVQSDWKAHSKVCGTREYKCDCGTIISRRDSFITHKAFCDALALETSRPINRIAPPNTLVVNPQLNNFQLPQESHGGGLSIKRELEEDHQQQHQLHLFSPTQLELIFSGGIEPSFLPTRSYNNDVATSNDTPSHMSATALLQRAAQIGAIMSQPLPAPNFRADQGNSPGLVFASPSEEALFGLQGLEGFANKPNGHHNDIVRDQMMTSVMSTMTNSYMCYTSGPGNSILEGLPYSNTNGSHFDHVGLVGGILNISQKLDHEVNNNYGETTTTATTVAVKSQQTEQLLKRPSEGMTRDFLGLRPAISSLHNDHADGFDLLRNSSTSSAVMSNNGGQQQIMMKDNKDQNQYILWKS